MPTVGQDSKEVSWAYKAGPHATCWESVERARNKTSGIQELF